jgi:hypothetical protein
MQTQDTKDNPLKCFNCGKIFKTTQKITSHKNKKTPCLIREVAPEQLANPNRCIFCNKIFSNKGNLHKHHTICKIKNGGMEILADKVKYEQKIRILEEQRIIDSKKLEEIDKLHEENKVLHEQINQINGQLKQLIEKPQVINANNTTINNTNNINIMINNYMKPNLEHLVGPQGHTDLTKFMEIFKNNGVQTPMALVPFIWFNPEAPQNLSIYLVNKLTGETLTHDGARWVVGNQDKISDDVRGRAYDITENICKFSKVCGQYEFILGNIHNNKYDTEVATIERARIIREFLQGREMVKVVR